MNYAAPIAAKSFLLSCSLFQPDKLMSSLKNVSLVSIVLVAKENLTFISQGFFSADWVVKLGSSETRCRVDLLLAVVARTIPSL